MLRKFLVAASAAVVLAGAALAQTDGQRIVIERGPSPAPRQEGLVRVQASINLFIPGPTGDTDEAARNRDRARRAIYEMAARECDLLREVLAKDCRMESVSTNIHRQGGQPQAVEGYNVTGQIGLQIMLK
jgi:hypothetical protein